jgi:hypothetical protein
MTRYKLGIQLHQWGSSPNSTVRQEKEQIPNWNPTPLTQRVDGRHVDNARPAPQRALLTPEPPQHEEQAEDKTSPKYSPRDPNTSSLCVPLSLQAQQVPEALFFWDVIQQPHSPPPCRTTAGGRTKYRRDIKVYSQAGLLGKTQKLRIWHTGDRNPLLSCLGSAFLRVCEVVWCSVKKMLSLRPSVRVNIYFFKKFDNFHHS